MPPTDTAAAVKSDAATVKPLAARIPEASQSLVVRFAHRFGVEPTKALATLKATAFKQRNNDPEPTNEQMMALLVVAEQYGLNPWTKELYAFADKGGIVPIVGVDGWSRIVNQHAGYNGSTFAYGPASDKHKGAPEWIECTVYRKDREHATTVREYLAECIRDTGPWKSHPARMLRHKAFMQAGRLAFGFVGLYDHDEAERIVEGEATRVAADGNAAVDKLNAGLGKTGAEPAGDAAPAASAVIDAEVVGTSREPAKPSGAPTFTYAEVAEKMNAAKDADALAEAVSLIDAITDAGQRAELHKIAEDREKAIAE